MRIRGTVIVIGLLVGCHLAQAQQDYRVAGTMLLSQGRSTAIITRPSGDAVTVGVGDALDDGRVAEIGERHVRVSFPGRELLLPLSGGPAQVVSNASSTSTQGPATEVPIDPTREALYSQHLPAKQLLFGIDELSVKLQREGYTDDDPEESGRALTRFLAGLIGFPEGAVIRDINGQSFSSVAEGLDLVENLLERDQPEAVRFGLAEASGPRPLYVFPQ